jgi:hypothetical protein
VSAGGLRSTHGQVDLSTETGTFRASVPSGASTGTPLAPPPLFPCLPLLAAPLAFLPLPPLSLSDALEARQMGHGAKWHMAQGSTRRWS